MARVRPVASAGNGWLDLARRASWLPYAFLPEVSPDALARYAAAEWGKCLAAPGGQGWSSDDAAILYQPLSWDSDVLGFSCARVSLAVARDLDRVREAEAASALLDAALSHARAHHVRHVSLRLDARAAALILSGERAGFHTVDGLLRFSFDLREPGPASLPDGVREARPEDIPALRSLAERGFTFDRFHADPAIPSAVADRLHAEWVEGAVRGRTGAGVLVAERDGRPAGFFIQAEDLLARDVLGFGVGQLVLIVVDAAHRGRGVGALLTQASVAWHRGRGNRHALVGTQLANVAATNLYRGGSRLVETSVSLRWWDGAV